MKSETVKVTKYGTFSLTATINKEAPTGYYSVSATGKLAGGDVETSGSFRVEEYRAPQFRVDVESKKKSLIAGEPLEATVFARYLFGGAMNDVQVKWSSQRTQHQLLRRGRHRLHLRAGDLVVGRQPAPRRQRLLRLGRGQGRRQGALAVKAGQHRGARREAVHATPSRPRSPT